MNVLWPIASFVAGVVVIGGTITALWAGWEILRAAVRFICANGQRAMEQDPHG